MELRLPQLFLQPGEILVLKKPALISTVLGSCVAVTLFDPAHRVGSICHALLPRGDEPGNGRFLNQALDRMLLRLDQLGLPPGDLEVKLFGGSDMFAAGEKRSITVGRMNVEAALAYLEQAGLKLKARDTGGRCGRKIQFDSRSGEVTVRRLQRQVLAAIEPLQ